MVEAQPLVQQRTEAEAGESNAVDQETGSRRRREAARDANGNRVVAVRRVRRETEAQDVDEADIETERVIQVGEHGCFACCCQSRFCMSVEVPFFQAWFWSNFLLMQNSPLAAQCDTRCMTTVRCMMIDQQSGDERRK